jgi:hypothetical protein
MVLHVTEEVGAGVEGDLVRSSAAQVCHSPSKRMGHVQKPTNLCREYGILIAVHGTCAGGQIRRTGIQWAIPCSPWVSFVTR